MANSIGVDSVLAFARAVMPSRLRWILIAIGLVVIFKTLGRHLRSSLRPPMKYSPFAVTVDPGLVAESETWLQCDSRRRTGKGMRSSACRDREGLLRISLSHFDGFSGCGVELLLRDSDPLVSGEGAAFWVGDAGPPFEGPLSSVDGKITLQSNTWREGQMIDGRVAVRGVEPTDRTGEYAGGFQLRVVSCK